MCLYSFCWAGTSHLGSVFGSGSHEVPSMYVWAGENLGEAEIPHGMAEVASCVALTIPDGIRSRGREAW